MPICYSFLNFRFFFLTISWVLFIRLLYRLNFVFVQLNIIAFVIIMFHFLFLAILMSFFLWWMCCSFCYACSIFCFFFFGRFCYVFRLKRLWSYALWFANVGFYCIWLIAIANNILHDFSIFRLLHQSWCLSLN